MERNVFVRLLLVAVLLLLLVLPLLVSGTESMFTETIDRVSVRGGTHLVTSQEMAAFDVPLPPRLPSCNECDGGTSAAGHSTWRHIEPDYLCGKTRYWSATKRAVSSHARL
ncbi:hypothetical protein E2C01_030222 [Portunus trituberculatus]|uniref:Uncharacterized protein n=1 Tax=Portunus trituberculatus TaxID=210409 RepID=A0A5B7EWQ7_PORTR|nr:hypothetical protein [Portunus trituberculatus]